LGAAPIITGSKQGRNKAIFAAHVKHGYTMKEIADLVGIHYTTVSKVISAHNQKSLFKT
jgi:transposase